MKTSLWFSSLRLSALVLFPEISAHRKCSLSVTGTWGFRPSQNHLVSLNVSVFPESSRQWWRCWMFLRLGSVCFCFSCWWCWESLRACFILHRGGLWEEGVKADITQSPVYIRSVLLWKVIWIKLHMCLQSKAHHLYIFIFISWSYNMIWFDMIMISSYLHP